MILIVFKTREKSVIGADGLATAARFNSRDENGAFIPPMYRLIEKSQAQAYGSKTVSVASLQPGVDRRIAHLNCQNCFGIMETVSVDEFDNLEDALVEFDKACEGA